jgi:molecular chaperone GrpE
VVEGVSGGESDVSDSPDTGASGSEPAVSSADAADATPENGSDEPVDGMTEEQSEDVNGGEHQDRPDGSDGADGTEGAADADAVDGNGSDTADEEGGQPVAEVTVEALVDDLERVSAERDQYLDASRRLQAEFENYKKQVVKREAEARERANDKLVNELLPVLDAFDGAIANGADDVAPMRTTFIDALAKQGLERIDPADAPFDPTLHEAVLHEDGDGGEDGPVVAEVMRAGYVWNGRVLRPAMVRTRG